MTQSAIFGPFLALMLLTLFVWVVMYVKRISYLTQHHVHPQKLTTPERLAEIVPEEVAYAANNLKNLFELPVLFYALCLYLYVSASVDALYLGLAWGFVALRVLHSIVHCSFNRVMVRFYLYVASAAALWIMLVRAALAWLMA